MSQQGMPWRDNYGLICCLISTIVQRYIIIEVLTFKPLSIHLLMYLSSGGYTDMMPFKLWNSYRSSVLSLQCKCIGYHCVYTVIPRDPQPLQNLRKEVADAEEILSKREIKTVEDLNVGDLATFMELTMPMELLQEFHWSDYPSLENLYRVCRKVPGFSEIHQPFLEFCQMYRTHRDAGLYFISASTRSLLPLTPPPPNIKRHLLIHL